MKRSFISLAAFAFTLGLGASLTASADNTPPMQSLMPSVTINGTATLTFPTDTSADCVEEIRKSAGYDPSDGSCNPAGCTFPSGTQFKFDKCQGVTLTFQAGIGSTCANTQAEFRLTPAGTWYDVSLVNGFNKAVTISGGAKTIRVNNAMTRNVDGVYPYGCSTCTGRIAADCGANNPNKYKCNKIDNCQINNDSSKNYVVTFH